MFSGALGERQVAWLASTEARVKSTMSMISSFKEVKMLGLSGDYLTSLQKLRLNEVNLGRYVALLSANNGLLVFF